MKRIKEKIKRIFPFKQALQVSSLGYSKCHICRLPWKFCESHCVHIDPFTGFIPVCEYCWTHHSKEENRQAVRDTYAWWKSHNMIPAYTLSEMLDAFEANWEATH